MCENNKELAPEQKKEVDELLEKAFKTGKETINVMGENFVPYMKILLKDNIKNPKEIAIIFGSFILQSKEKQDGYKWISKNQFLNFYQEFKNKN